MYSVHFLVSCVAKFTQKKKKKNQTTQFTFEVIE